jgi:hypothetical protein
MGKCVRLASTDQFSKTAPNAGTDLVCSGDEPPAEGAHLDLGRRALAASHDVDADAEQPL